MPSRLSHSAALILKALSHGYSFGFDIMEITGLPSGTVYPALRRLERDELACSQWEAETEVNGSGRPARRYYEITTQGKAATLAATDRYPLLSRLLPGEAGMRPVRLRLEDILLRYGQQLVPADQRAEWLRSWQGELWYERSRSRHDLCWGLIRDALWLRTDRWRRGLSGTAGLCLVLLLLLVAVAALPAVAVASSTGDLLDLGVRLLPRFAVASGLTLFVSYAASFANTAMPYSKALRPWVRAWTFHAAKVLLVLVLSALVSVDVCLPLELRACFAALPLELLLFVMLALLGLRWNLLDERSRCRLCLRSLAPPQRIGRPSRNFLEYNGTELTCRYGHGLLTVPELETSWCRSSAWIAQAP